ncbi:MAG: hypothetical protein AAF316_00030 [Cyanobacteria bacterium P01_A01_bin.80]
MTSNKETVLDLTPVVHESSEPELKELSKSSVAQNKESGKHFPSDEDDNEDETEKTKQTKQLDLDKQISFDEDAYYDKKSEFLHKIIRAEKRLARYEWEIETGRAKRAEYAEDIEKIKSFLQTVPKQTGQYHALRVGKNALETVGIEPRVDENGIFCVRIKDLMIGDKSFPVKIRERIEKWRWSELKPLTRVGKEIAKEWEGIINETNKSLSAFAKNVDFYPSCIETHLRGDGGNGDKEFIADKVIPAKELFDKDIQEATIKELMPIFKGAELEMMALHLGRVCAGRSGILGDKRFKDIRTNEQIVHPDKWRYNLEHGYRYVAVVTGEPGVGKTTLMNKVNSVLSQCGYSTDVLPRSNNQFGWSAAQADHLFASDMTQEELISLQKNTIIKEIVSNDEYSDEKKGKEKIKKLAKCALTVCANGVSYPDKVDAGIADRFHFLQTLSVKEFLNETGEENLYLYWCKLAKKYETSVDVLVAYLLRLCLEKFLDAIGYEWGAYDEKHPNPDRRSYGVCGSGRYFYNSKKVRLNRIIKDLRKRYQIQPPQNLKQVLSQGSIKASIVGVKNGKQYDEEFDWAFGAHYLSYLSQVMNQINLKCRELSRDSNEYAFYRELYTWLIPDKTVHGTTWRKYERRVKDYVVAHPETDYGEIWVKTIKCFISSVGEDAPSNPKEYVSYYEYGKTQNETYEREYIEMCKKYNMDSTQIPIFKEIDFPIVA